MHIWSLAKIRKEAADPALGPGSARAGALVAYLVLHSVWDLLPGESLGSSTLLGWLALASFLLTEIAGILLCHRAAVSVERRQTFLADYLSFYTPISLRVFLIGAPIYLIFSLALPFLAAKYLPGDLARQLFSPHQASLLDLAAAIVAPFVVFRWIRREILRLNQVDPSTQGEEH